MKNAEEYAEIIMLDEREKIAAEKPVVYETHKIERIYEFEDGAVVKYEWQDIPPDINAESYNHRFTLISLPSPNPRKFTTGIIKTINYSENNRR